MEGLRPVLLALAALTPWAGAAAAQSCAAAGPAATRCRFVLSAPQTFTVQAGALLDRPTLRPGMLAVSVDGRVCQAARTTLRDRVFAACPVALAPGEHVVEGRLEGASEPARGVGVRLQPSLHFARPDLMR